MRPMLFVVLASIVLTGCGALPYERYIPNVTYVADYQQAGVMIHVTNAEPGTVIDVLRNGIPHMSGITVNHLPVQVGMYNPFPDRPAFLIIEIRMIDQKTQELVNSWSEVLEVWNDTFQTEAWRVTREGVNRSGGGGSGRRR